MTLPRLLPPCGCRAARRKRECCMEEWPACRRVPLPLCPTLAALHHVY